MLHVDETHPVIDLKYFHQPKRSQLMAKQRSFLFKQLTVLDGLAYSLSLMPPTSFAGGRRLPGFPGFPEPAPTGRCLDKRLGYVFTSQIHLQGKSSDYSFISHQPWQTDSSTYTNIDQHISTYINTYQHISTHINDIDQYRSR